MVAWVVFDAALVIVFYILLILDEAAAHAAGV